MNYILPDTIRKKAFIASNGELAWKREDLNEIAHAYAKRGFAIEHYEIWVVSDNGSWNGMIPMKDSDIPHVIHWEVRPRDCDETDQEFADRAAAELLSTVDHNPLDEIVEAVAPRIRYNLYVESEFPYSG